MERGRNERGAGEGAGAEVAGGVGAGGGAGSEVAGGAGAGRRSRKDLHVVSDSLLIELFGKLMDFLIRKFDFLHLALFSPQAEVRGSRNE